MIGLAVVTARLFRRAGRFRNLFGLFFVHRFHLNILWPDWRGRGGKGKPEPLKPPLSSRLLT
jgi:hypothetical protein